DALCAPEDAPPFRAYAVAGPFRCTRRIPPCRHRAELEDTRQLYLATIAEHPGCMRRLSVSGVQPRAVGRAFNSLTPAETKTGPKMLHRKGLVRSSTTFSTASVRLGPGAMSAQCPVCPKADKAGRFTDDTCWHLRTWICSPRARAASGTSFNVACISRIDQHGNASSLRGTNFVQELRGSPVQLVSDFGLINLSI